MKHETRKCTVEFRGTGTNMSVPIEIRPREFDAQLTFLLQQVAETAACRYPVRYRTYHKEDGKSVASIYRFVIAMSETILTETQYIA